MRVLIVDDQVLFRASIALLLARLDAEIEVTDVGSVEQALVLARSTPPDFELLLLDLNMRGTQGLDGLRSVRQAFPGSALVILSGLESPEAMREARARAQSVSFHAQPPQGSDFQ